MDAGVHLGHGLLAALEGLGLGLVDAGLHVLDLGIQKLALPLKTLSSILLTAELIGKPGGIDHGTLGLLLAESGLGSHLIEVAGESGHLGLDLHLGGLDGLVLASLVAEGLVGVSKLLLHHASGTVCLLQQSAGLLQSILVGVALAVSDDQSVVGLLQVALKVQDISLQLLLHPQSLSLALGLSLNSGLHVLKALAHVLLGGGEFLLLLGNPALDLLPHLSELQLSTEDLVLLLLKSSLGLAEGGLQLHLLGLKALADFVNLVDGASTLADLVHDVLDLIGEVLVLPPDFVKLEDSLLVGRLNLEQLG